MKYLIFIVLLVAVLITAGCVGGNQNSVVTPTPQIVYVTVLVTQTQTASSALDEHIVTLSFSNYLGSPLVGAEVSVTPISTTSSTGNLGVGTQYATTDSSGRVVFSLSSTTKYNLIFTYQGKKTYDTIYPSSSYYNYGIK